MRSVWFRGVAVGGASLVALAMLAINAVFQAAGSIPDLETCGFLSGNLVALLVLYPLCAWVVAGKAVRPLLRRFPGEEGSITECGGTIALWGALGYFSLGVISCLCSPYPRPLPPVLWVLLALYVGLAALAGRMGAAMAVGRARTAGVADEGV